MTQRWRDGRASYRPAREVVDTSTLEVAEIDEGTAKTFVLAHHYSDAYPSARVRVGLYQAGQLAGVAVLSHPMQDAVLDVLPNGRKEGTELGRLVLLDHVGANAETWLLARVFEVCRRHRFTGLVSHSDPVPRRNAAGELTLPGHVGTIYQAGNGRYTGRTKARTQWLLPSGGVYSERSIAKVKAGDQGWRYAADQLRSAGAGPLTSDPAAWLAEWLPRVCRRVHHPGCHRYVWAVDKRIRRALDKHLEVRASKKRSLIRLGLPYPKSIDPEIV